MDDLDEKRRKEEREKLWGARVAQAFWGCVGAFYCYTVGWHKILDTIHDAGSVAFGLGAVALLALVALAVLFWALAIIIAFVKAASRISDRN